MDGESRRPPKAEARRMTAKQGRLFLDTFFGEAKKVSPRRAGASVSDINVDTT